MGTFRATHPISCSTKKTKKKAPLFFRYSPMRSLLIVAFLVAAVLADTVWDEAIASKKRSEPHEKQCPPGSPVDVCGVCFGKQTNVSLCVPGCNHVNGSGLVFDQCYVCGGRNESCVCPTQRWMYWVLIGFALGLFPLTIFVVLRYFVFITKYAPLWFVILPLGGGNLIGDGAFGTLIYEEQRQSAIVWTFVGTAIFWLILIASAVVRWTSGSNVVCYRIIVSNWYVSFITLAMCIMAGFAMAAFYSMLSRSSKLRK